MVSLCHFCHTRTCVKFYILMYYNNIYFLKLPTLFQLWGWCKNYVWTRAHHVYKLEQETCMYEKITWIFSIQINKQHTYSLVGQETTDGELKDIEFIVSIIVNHIQRLLFKFTCLLLNGQINLQEPLILIVSRILFQLFLPSEQHNADSNITFPDPSW